jgi:hypothetical protein
MAAACPEGYFNVFCDFLDTPRRANTPVPPVGSGAFVAATFSYTDDNHFCHLNILELNFIREKMTQSSASKKTGGAGGTASKPLSPYKRKKPGANDGNVPSAPPRRRVHVPAEPHVESSAPSPNSAEGPDADAVAGDESITDGHVAQKSRRVAT